MRDEQRFPVLDDPRIASVPWRIIEPHRAQALRNHGQTLERLAERGGLSLSELVVVLADDRGIGFFERKENSRKAGVSS